MGNEAVRRTTLGFVAFHSTPLIYPMRQVQDNYYQLRVTVQKRASESYFQDGTGKTLHPVLLKIS